MSALLDAADRTTCTQTGTSVGSETSHADRVVDRGVAREASVPSLLILADDLSGAADCAATAVRHGARAMVALTPLIIASNAGPQSDTSAHDVLAIDLDSRRMTAAEAADVHRDAVYAYRAHHLHHAHQTQGGQATLAGRARIFKKVDSTLRGHLAAEVAALAPLVGLAIVAPALPEAGRTTVGGRQLLHGIPVEETEVWRNEQLSGTADLVAMLQVAGLTVRHQPVPQHAANAGVDAAPTHWREAIQAARDSGAQALVCDALSKADLDAIADASVTQSDVFWVGSAGLARSLTRALSDIGAFDVRRDASIAHTPSARTHVQRGALFVVGSMSSVSHAQIAALGEVVGETLQHIEIDVADLLSDAADAASLREALGVSDVTTALQAGRDVVVSLAQRDRSRVGEGYRLAQAFGACLATAVGDASAVFATGGETARALLSAASIACFTLDTEIAPGVPLSLAQVLTGSDGRARWLPIVTKAGAFGDKDTLAVVWRHLKTLAART